MWLFTSNELNDILSKDKDHIKDFAINPFIVLKAFLDVLSRFDWRKYGISLTGLVSLNSSEKVETEHDKEKTVHTDYDLSLIAIVNKYRERFQADYHSDHVDYAIDRKGEFNENVDKQESIDPLEEPITPRPQSSLSYDGISNIGDDVFCDADQEVRSEYSSKDAFLGRLAVSELNEDRSLNNEESVESKKSECNNSKRFYDQYKKPPVAHSYGDLCVLDPFKPQKNLCSTTDKSRKNGSVCKRGEMLSGGEEVSLELTEIFVMGLHHLEIVLGSTMEIFKEGSTAQKAVDYMQELFPVLSEKIDLKSVLNNSTGLDLMSEECELAVDLSHPDIAELQATLCYAEIMMYSKDRSGSQEFFPHSNNSSNMSHRNMTHSFPRALR